MADYIMMSKAVFNGKYHTHPLSQLKMQLMRTYQNIIHLDSMVELGPTSFVDFVLSRFQECSTSILCSPLWN